MSFDFGGFPSHHLEIVVTLSGLPHFPIPQKRDWKLRGLPHFPIPQKRDWKLSG